MNASLIGVDVEISLSKIRSIQVFVLGKCLQSWSLYSKFSIKYFKYFYFFQEAPDKNGSLRNIEVKRDGETIGNFDFYESYLINGNTKSDIRLQSNDAIVINPIGKTVKIMEK